MSARATRLYVLTMRLLSFVAMMVLFAANFFIGSSIRRSSCRDHMMFPATGGALRASGGPFLCFS